MNNRDRIVIGHKGSAEIEENYIDKTSCKNGNEFSKKVSGESQEYDSISINDTN